MPIPGLSPEEIEYMKAHEGDNISKQHIAANAVCAVATVIGILLRVASRLGSKKKIWLDDWLIIFAVIPVLGHAICSIVAFSSLGYGRHVLFVGSIRSFRLIILATQLIYNFGIMIIKLSILCLYHRIFAISWITRTIKILGIIVIIYTIAQSFGQIFACVPIQALWETVEGARCIDLHAATTSNAVLNIVTDIALLMIPLPVIWSLHLGNGRAKRIGLTLMFSAGISVCIVSIFRIAYLPTDSHDPTWDYSITASLSTLELTLALIAACIPTYRPLFNLIHSRWKTSSVISPPGSQTAPTTDRTLLTTLQRETPFAGEKYGVQTRIGRGSNDLEFGCRGTV